MQRLRRARLLLPRISLAFLERGRPPPNPRREEYIRRVIPNPNPPTKSDGMGRHGGGSAIRVSHLLSARKIGFQLSHYSTIGAPHTDNRACPIVGPPHPHPYS